ncbi:MAG: hypothetical protein IJX93_07845 [Clostridia bacterium]|nr:hypothetical protein [Clostridia bacterium]MBQ8333670.1 hypothetical protein [Clostridia bacterium]MBQ8368389.1 hypothetical protein [Clostridia bacterium]MBQ8512322.1 hypothetical protein [Clostridia bacterium]
MEELKEKIEAIVEKLTENKDLMDDFKKEPIKTVEKLLGIDLPDEKLEAIVDGVKAKISFDKLDDALDGKLGDALGGVLKKLF